MPTSSHPAPWWYRLAARVIPSRCREIPEANNPDRIVLRQVAIVKRYAYLQGFASSEDAGFMHSHQWRHLLVFVLSGRYNELRLVGLRSRWVKAPAVYHMGPDVIHRVRDPVRHCSLAIGFGRDESLRAYYPVRYGIPWAKHVRRKVVRL